MFTLKFTMSFLIAVQFLLLATYARAQTFGQAVVVYEWNLVDFDWPSEAEKSAAIDNETYVPNRNLVVGIKVYKDDVFVTIPRWFWQSGHPVALAKVVKVNNESKLQPYPNWAYQNKTDCRYFQYVMSMEIDPNTGLMYVIDTGRVGNVLNLCPAKLYVFDLSNSKQVDLYEFPNEVVNRTKNFLNDIVLDYVNGQVKFAYMSDAYDSRLIIYDFEKRSSYYLSDASMRTEVGNVITFNGQAYPDIHSDVNGIAISPDFKYVYYCAVSSYSLYQIPTSTLRNVSLAGTTGLRNLGKKMSQSGGIAYGSRRLYYGALGLNAVYFWDAEKDMADQGVGMDKVNLTTETLLVKNDTAMQWPDTFGFDNQGWLWFTSDRLPLFWNKGIPQNTTDGGAFMRVWKVYVNETGYLYQADSRTKTENGAGTTFPLVGASIILSVIISLCLP